jgi:tetratricopeptide (TPR) repeat protein
VRGLIATSVVLGLLGLPFAARADKPTPWAAGVPKDKQQKALELFRTGNTYFEESKYTEALAQYEKAIPLWDHPSIEYNLAVCLFNIRQPLEAWDHLEKALKYGDAPLGKKLYSDALTYKNLLESSLAQLEVSSDDDDVQVMLDGRELFTGKEKKMVHLLAGAHQLVATREGYETKSKALDMPAGKVTHEDISLDPVKVKIKTKTVRENYDRRWAWWVPWSAAAGSVGLALIGTGVYLEGHSDINAYDKALAKQCPMGCTRAMIPPTLVSQEQHAEHVGSIGIGLWSAAAVVGAASGVMAILNRPRQTEGHPEMAVIVTPGYVGASLALTFE